MFSISAIKGKFKRSRLDLKKTFLYEEKPFIDEESLNLLQMNEECIIYYKEGSKYNWYLTNERFILPNKKKAIFLQDLKKVDIPNIKENPNQKMENKELTLFTQKEEIVFFVEDKSWHLFYNIFKFIIENN